MEPTGLYVHVPFCTRRCAYCDFASHTYNSERVDLYLDALSLEIEKRAQALRPVTLFVGGGTPTSLALHQFEYFLDLLTNLDLSRLEEFTVEANPGTLSMQKLFLLRQAGVTRLSLGVQTFQDRGLEVLGRSHDARTARLAVAQVQEVGFDDFSLDFIFAWPGQSELEWAADLGKALGLAAPHLSCYCLSHEEGTPLQQRIDRGELAAAGENLERRLFDLTGTMLAAGGMPRYEISNFALPGHECRHNLNYWLGGGYIGLGPGAHSYVGGVRFGNCTQVEEYKRRLETVGTAEAMRDELPPAARARECAVVWLRLAAGIDKRRFHDRTGFDLEMLLARELPPLLAGGWLRWSEDDTRLHLSEQALPVADSVLAELVA